MPSRDLHPDLACARAAALLGLLLALGSAHGADTEDDDNADEPSAVSDPVPSPDEAQEPSQREPCPTDADGDAWIDKMQRGVHRTVCSTALWFDGFFGELNTSAPHENSYGRLGVGFDWDERDGFGTALRLRAKLALPALERRVGVLIGRGDENELIEDRSGAARDALPTRTRDVNDDDWLIGLGYSSEPGTHRGFDFRVGARLGLPVEPYVKGIGRWSFAGGEHSDVRLQETLFWRSERGFGATSRVDVDRLIGQRSLLRWTTIGTVAEDVRGVEWDSSLTLYRNLSPRRAIGYTALVRGETENEVSLQNYGLELRYRQRVARKWLFVELLGSVTWPRETLAEERNANFGAGIGFEMYFGRIPEHAMP